MHRRGLIQTFFSLLKCGAAEFRDSVAILQADGAPPAQRTTARRVTDRLVRLRQRLTNNDINVYQYAGFVGAVLKLHD